MLSDEFVKAGGDELLHSQAQLTLFGIDGEQLRFDHLADAKHVAGVVDALFGAHIADVNHAFDALGDLNKRALGKRAVAPPTRRISQNHGRRKGYKKSVAGREGVLQ